MQWLAKLCVRRPVFAAVLMLTIVVVGAAGYFKLGLDQFPKVDFPVVVVTTRLDGAAPEEVETEITDKIEEAVNTISGIDELRSTSVEGVSQLFITFTLEKPVDVAAQDVRDHVNLAIAQLPHGHRPAGRRQARSRRGADPLRRRRVDQGACARPPRSPTSACAGRSRASTASGRSTSSAGASGRSTSGSTRSSCARWG